MYMPESSMGEAVPLRDLINYLAGAILEADTRSEATQGAEALRGDAASITYARQQARQVLADHIGLRVDKLRQHETSPATDELLQYVQAILPRIRTGEPLAYITGRAWFWDMELEVGPGVLIPRPDSETLLRALLEYGQNSREFQAYYAEQLQRAPYIRVLEACVGSACLSLALLREAENRRFYPVRIDGTDISPQALGYARQNAMRYDTAQCLSLYQADLFPPTTEQADQTVEPPYALLIANPPYIDATDYAALDASVRDFEPIEALLAGEEGLAFYRRLLVEGRAYCRPGSYLFAEHGARQRPALEQLAREIPGVRMIDCIRDYGGRERVTVFRFDDGFADIGGVNLKK